MQIEVISAPNGSYDAVVCIVPADRGIAFSQPVFQQAYNDMFAGDCMKVAHGEIKLIRFKASGVFCDLIAAGFDSNINR